MELLAAVREARNRYRAGGGTVVEHLAAITGARAEQLGASLAAAAGAQVLTDVHLNSTLDLQCLEGPAGALPVLLFKLGGLPGTHVAMADPWDEPYLTAVAGPKAANSTRWAASASQLQRYAQQAAPRLPQAPGPPAANAAQASVVEFVDAALRSAYEQAASDVHFECDRQGLAVKFRHNGVMCLHQRWNEPQRAEEVISRLKVLAQLDITERRVPQDGRLRMAVSSQVSLDLRVSIMPSIHGEDAVLRLLDKTHLRSAQGAVTLETLGFCAANAATLRSLAQQPHGMLLVTGPTGSGKTTTLYAVLSEVNNGAEKIITIEDPVEYELAGVLQIPVNERKGLTFARGLRSILRHDPDRILVGEIRDAETAEIAVQSALTGHQVYTTVHANSVFDVLGRFRYFGLDLYGFMSSLNGVLVQRLVRCACGNCLQWRKPQGQEQAWLLGQGVQAERLPYNLGCSVCANSGFTGRMALAEVHVVDDGFRDLVTQAAPIGELRRHVAGQLATGLQQQAAQLCAQGRTTVAEVQRVLGSVGAPAPGGAGEP